MSRISFTKLGVKVNTGTKTLSWNDQTIEVRQYIPANEKLEMLTSIINQAQDDNNFINPIKLDVFTVLEIVSGYAGVTFTEKQKENPAKLYDALKSSGFYKAVVNSIPKSEYKEFLNSLVCLVEKIYNYRTSVLGILDTISADYSNLNLDATDIQKKLADPENMALLKSVLTKLG